MEISGVVSRPIPCFSGVGFDNHSSKSSFSSSLYFNAGNQFSSGELKLLGSRDSKVSVIRARSFSGISNPGFPDEGHLGYYVSSVCGTKKMKEQQKEKKKKKKKKNPEIATIKKKLKLIKGLSKDLLMFSSMGFGLETEDGLLGEVKEKKISEAAEVLLAQLQLLRAEEKEMKRKRKEEKARLKAMQIKNEIDCESSSNSSESSDNECGNVVDLSRLRTDSVSTPNVDELQVSKTPVEGTMTSTRSVIDQDKKRVQVEEIENRSSENCRQGCCNGSSSSISTSCSNGRSICQSSSGVVMPSSSQRIEVCMGGKCKKSGAAALMEEFERRVGTGGVVVSCKCMSKCKDGPNVRVLNQCNGDDEESKEEGIVRRHPTNPLCIGVGLEDVGVIVANLFGEERKDLGMNMMAAA